jgi:thymidine kinase
MRRLSQQHTLEVISGPMFSGKTHELIERLTAAKENGLSVVASKPLIDSDPHELISLTGARWPATPIGASTDLLAWEHKIDVLGIDEAQFLDSDLPVVVDRLRRRVRLVVAGLDLDFRGEPFGVMPRLVDQASDLARLTAVCEVCGGPATVTQRIRKGELAPRREMTIQLGGRELYEPRCERCFVKPE